MNAFFLVKSLKSVAQNSDLTLRPYNLEMFSFLNFTDND